MPVLQLLECGSVAAAPTVLCAWWSGGTAGGGDNVRLCCAQRV